MADFPEARILLEHAGFVRRLAHQLAGPVHADDVQQEAFARAAHRPPGRTDNLRGWFGRVVTNIWRNQRRDAVRRSAREAAAAGPREVPAVDEIVILEECRRRVVAAVVALPQPLRDVVLLRFYEGLDSPAIGRRLGRPASTVRSQLQQACELLRARLDADYDGRRQAWVGPLLAWSRHLQGGSPVPAAPRIAARSLVAAATVAVTWAVVGWVWPDRPQRPDAVVLHPAAAPAVASFAAVSPPAERAAVAGAIPAPSAPPEPSPLPVGMLRLRATDGATAQPVDAANLRVTAVATASSLLAGVTEELAEATTRACVADADGIGVFRDLPVGTYDVEASTTDGRHAWRRVSLGSSERRLELEVSRQPFRGVVAVKVIDPEGRPMPDAAVELACVCTRRGLLGTAARPPIAGRTDARGLFLLRDSQQVEIISEGLVTARAVDGRIGCRQIPRPEHRGDSPWFEVTVRAPGAIAGRLSGPRQDWCSVQVVAMAAWTYASVRPQCVVGNFPLDVAADGAFSGRDLPAGRYHLAITGATGLGDRRCAQVSSWQSQPLVEVPVGGVVQADIELVPQPLVRGRVLDEAGAPLPGAAIVALKTRGEGLSLLLHPSADDPPSPSTTAAARTDASGRYELAIWPGRWHLVATAPHRQMNVCPVEVGAGAEVAEVEHRLVVAGGLRGRTTGDHVALRSHDTAASPSVVHLLTTVDGGFVVSGLAPAIWEIGRFDGDFRPMATVRVAAGCTAWVDTAAAGGRRVRGVLHGNGQPLPGIGVGVGGDAARVVTDALGVFETWLPMADGDTRLQFTHRGLRIGVHRVAGDDCGVIDLPLRRIDIEVVDAGGGPVAVTMNLSDPGSTRPSRLRQFLPDGLLDCQWAETGHALDVDARDLDGGRIRQRIPAGVQPVRLRLPAVPGGRIAVRLLDGHGSPRVAGSMAAVAWGRDTPAPTDGATFWQQRSPAGDDGAARVPAHARTDADGWARFEGLPPGPVLVWFADDWSRYGYEASVTRRGPPPVEHVATVRPGQTHTIELALPR